MANMKIYYRTSSEPIFKIGQKIKIKKRLHSIAMRVEAEKVDYVAEIVNIVGPPLIDEDVGYILKDLKWVWLEKEIEGLYQEEKIENRFEILDI